MAEKKPTKKPSPATTIKSKAKSVQQNVAAVGTKRHVGGFVEFIRSQGVIGLAVGLAIGSAAGSTVKTIVEGFINPIVQFIVGSNAQLEANVWHVELWGRTADFRWGAVLSSTITLLATALVIYWLVNVFKLNKLDKPKQ